MTKVIEMAEKNGLLVSESAKTQNNGKELKTYVFKKKEDDVVLTQFEKDCLDGISEDELEEFFAVHIMKAMDADIVKMDKDAPEYMFNLLRTGTVFPVAINADANEELLKEVPHRRVMDLALVYRLIVSIDEDGVSSVLYTNRNMVLAGVSEAELFERAVEHARENICTRNVMDILEENRYEFNADKAGEHRGELMVIRNETQWFGSGILALWALEDGITIDLESDVPLFVLPSSIHEMLVIKGIDASKEDVSNPIAMVRNVNTMQVSAEERLSNSVYQYNPETKKVTLAMQGEPLSYCENFENFLREFAEDM